MKKLLYLAIFGGIMFSCGGSDPAPPTPPQNSAPTVPVQVYPANKELCIDNSVSFSWNASTDADGDKIYYTVEVSDKSDFSSITHSKPNLTTTSVAIALDKGTVFYWRVKATDKKDPSAFSSNNQFYTEGDGIVNHLPFSPDLVAPTLDVVVKEADFTPTTELNAVLEWTASDVDTDDTLTFDVYFGTTDPTSSTPVSENQTETTYSATLAAATTYYWKVVVKDDKGGETIGQVWKFKTD